jgi:hypothetical protein
MKPISALVLLLACLANATHTWAASIFFFTSSPQSWVGQGLTQTLTAPEYTIRGFKYPDPSGTTISVTILKGNGDGWRVDFAGPNHEPLAVGSYPNARRYPFNVTRPGLAFHGFGRGDNTLTGSFEVLDLALETSGQVQRFAADFIQFDEGISTKWNIGSVRYNSDVPVTIVPEPSAVLLAAATSPILIPRRRKSDSHNRV